MDNPGEGLKLVIVRDEDQNLDDSEREVLYTAFQIMERQLHGQIELIVARTEENSFAFMEPNHGTPDYGRILRKLARLVLFVSGNG